MCTFASCSVVENKYSGIWKSTYNWTKNPKYETEATIFIRADSFIIEEENGKSLGMFKIQNDSIIATVTIPTNTIIKGILLNDTTISGVMINFSDTGWWKAQKQAPDHPTVLQ